MAILDRVEGYLPVGPRPAERSSQLFKCAGGVMLRLLAPIGSWILLIVSGLVLEMTGNGPIKAVSQVGIAFALAALVWAVDICMAASLAPCFVMDWCNASHAIQASKEAIQGHRVRCAWLYMQTCLSAKFAYLMAIPVLLFVSGKLSVAVVAVMGIMDVLSTPLLYMMPPLIYCNLYVDSSQDSVLVRTRLLNDGVC